MSPLIGALVGAAAGLGLVLIVAGWRGHTLRLPTSSSGQKSRQVTAAQRRRILLAVAAGLLVGLATRWPIAAFGAVAAVWAAPRMFGAQGAGARELERLEALATWTESLRDTIAGSMSLEQAIPTTVDASARTLREPLRNLVAMLRTRVPLTEALGRFADDLDDPGADLVVAALQLNARLRGPGLEATLSELAVHAREELEQRQVVEAGRKTLHRSARIIVGVVAAFTVGLVLFARDFVQPYSSLQGELVLCVVGAVFVFSFMRLRRLSEFHRPARFLTSDKQQSLQEAVTRP